MLLDENPKTTQAPFTAGKVPKVKGDRQGSPKTSADVKCIRRAGVPCKTLQQTEWSVSIWRDWARHRLGVPKDPEETQYTLKEEL